jgi:CRISPR-associated protein Cas2
MLVVICYDIADDKRRRRVDKVLSGYGVRVQESVFEAEMDEKRYLEVRRKLKKEIDETEDNVRFYRQCLRCRSAVEVLGVGTYPTDGPEFLII